MRLVGFLAYIAGILAWTIAVAASVANIFSFLFSLPESASGLPWLIFWVLGTFGPIALSVLSWIFVQRTDAQWLPHLAFIPISIFIFVAGIWAFKAAAGTPIDDMKEADAVVLGGGYLFLALLVHVTAIAVSIAGALRRAVKRR